MSGALDEEYKNAVCHHLCVSLGGAIKRREIPDRELCEVCNFILVAFKSMQTPADLIDFLGKLAARWSPFSAVFLAEKAKLDTMPG
ncbi:hypothetical protein A2154_02715 [Candidatus Gottesmanbacteria bacterium RBG_16_43_7]|uniref:Uncharacterized protein n=1 Tax=Candidatus Gottesmanbacteria bacterium RBG_16_43_7 TaxID=1798373 RepID=A0A1F5Z958_9BACT|nr:MAG: hypothetical protein A2154_02715 [Candidatus Gottesmanbacteria bacterium RBG_16_43_7]